MSSVSWRWFLGAVALWVRCVSSSPAALSILPSDTWYVETFGGKEHELTNFKVRC